MWTALYCSEIHHTVPSGYLEGSARTVFGPSSRPVTAISGAGLEFEEDLSLIQPVTETPHRQQNRAGLSHGGEVTEPCKAQREYSDGPIQPSLQNLMHAIEEDRIGAQHD